MYILSVDAPEVSDESKRYFTSYFRDFMLDEVAKTVRQQTRRDLGVAFFSHSAAVGLNYISTFAENFPGIKSGIQKLIEIGVAEEEAKRKMRSAQRGIKKVTEDYHAGEILSPQDEFITAANISDTESLIKELNRKIREYHEPIESTGEEFQMFKKGLLEGGLKEEDGFYKYLINLITIREFQIQQDQDFDYKRILTKIFDDKYFPPAKNKKTIYGVSIEAVRFLKKFVENRNSLISKILLNKLDNVDFGDDSQRAFNLRKRKATFEMVLEFLETKPFIALLGNFEINKNTLRLASNPLEIVPSSEVESIIKSLVEIKKKMVLKHTRQFSEGLRSTFTPTVKYENGILSVTLLGIT